MADSGDDMGYNACARTDALGLRKLSGEDESQPRMDGQ